MNDSIVKLHPKNYKEIAHRLVFYMNEQKISEELFQAIFEELRAAKTLIVTSYKKSETAERRYSLYVGHYVLNFFGSEYLNYQCTSVLSGKKAVERKSNLYRTRIFTIIPSGGVYVVYNKEIHPVVDDKSWKMDQDVYMDLLEAMEEYFESDFEEEEEPQEEKKNRIRVSERFRKNIIRPFRDYTDKENWVEMYKQMQGEGVFYYKRMFLRREDKSMIYGFYSRDENADPENSCFSVGDRINVVDTKEGEHGVYTGVLQEIDNESDDSVIFSVAFYRQADDVDFPESGKLVLSTNDTQTKVRSRVIRSLEHGRVESKYMYKVFEDFTVAGYEEIPEDLKEYLAEKMAGEYPPNQMQLEAIIKGILTDDLLLVLGPPGTGKTTVISFWVEYFIRKGQRVLISSQNNAAVDNVLARFGEIAETVRLGNESKVQEDCKPYLPQNKISSMQLHFNENYQRIKAEIAQNKDEIRHYRDRLSEYQRLMDLYVEKSSFFRKLVDSISGAASSAFELHTLIKNFEVQIDALMEARAHKVIFLQVYEKKNFFVRLLKKRYAMRVRKELEDGDRELERLRGEYRTSIEKYNTFMQRVNDKVTDFRSRNTIVEYISAQKNLVAYTKVACSREFLPHFVGETASLYQTPSYTDGIVYNMQTVASQRRVLDELEKAIAKMESAITAWNEIVNNESNDIMQNALLETCRVVGATCIGINSNRDFANVKFDVAIVDEAGQIQIHNALIPMSRARKNLLLGDYKQIPPCANEDVIAACVADEVDTKLLNMSFFEYVFEAMRKKLIAQLESEGLDRRQILQPVLADYAPVPFQHFDSQIVQQMIMRVTCDAKKIVNLNCQFRMPGDISDIISEWFYEGNYFSSYNMKNFVPMVPGTEKPLIVVSTSEAPRKEESQPESKMGYHNYYEAQLIAEMVKNVINAQPEQSRTDFIDKIESEIGIISAYGAQVRLIRECLAKKKLGIRESQIRSMVASLDSFQGQERPLILYSLTRSTSYKDPEKGRVGFMKELRRLNVAFTRCKKQLVIVGDIAYLSACMNMENTEDNVEWPCVGQVENTKITIDMINQCAECSAKCERKFARFMRLLMQHVNQGAGNLIMSEEYLGRNA